MTQNATTTRTEPIYINEVWDGWHHFAVRQPPRPGRQPRSTRQIHHSLEASRIVGDDLITVYRITSDTLISPRSYDLYLRRQVIAELPKWRSPREALLINGYEPTSPWRIHESILTANVQYLVGDPDDAMDPHGPFNVLAAILGETYE